MNKLEIAKRAAAASKGSKNPLTIKQIVHATNLFLQELMKALASGEADKVELRGFATFKNRTWPAREITMPSGQVVETGPTWVPKIKPHPKWRNLAKRSQSS